MNTNNQIIFCHPANSEKVHQLKGSELLTDNEFCCPPFDDCLWSSHPRVCLKLDKHGEVVCPYCHTLYTLNTK